MGAEHEGSRDAVIAAASLSLVRIALAFGLLNAVVPLWATLRSGESLQIGFNLLWIAGWLLAAYRAKYLLKLLKEGRVRWISLLILGAVTIVTVSTTGGASSPLKTGGNWLGWAATVAMSARESLAAASVFSVSLLGALLVSGLSVTELVSPENRYVVATGMLNPFVIVLVALALAGVFQLLVKEAPGTVWTPVPSERPPEPEPHAPSAALAEVPPPAEGVPGFQLTVEDQELVEDLVRGLTPQQIALHRGCSTSQVYRLLSTARGKVGARTNEQLVVVAWERRRER